MPARISRNRTIGNAEEKPGTNHPSHGFRGSEIRLFFAATNRRPWYVRALKAKNK
jgi:hypothetical protein